MAEPNEIDLSKKPKKGLLKKHKKETPKPVISDKDQKRPSVMWDMKNLKENEEYLKAHPPTMIIDEPKTPYDPYLQGDDAYLDKVSKMFKVQPTEDVLKDVCEELMKNNNNDNKNENENDEEKYVDVEVMENGKLIKKKVTEERRNNIEFLKKRKIAYGNEFSIAKEMEEKEKKNYKDLGLDDEEQKKETELDDMTLKNTIINKFSSMVYNNKSSEEIKNLINDKLKEEKAKGDSLVEKQKELEKQKEEDKK